MKKGDVLFVIDPRPFAAELNRAKAQLDEAKANYTQSLAQLNEAKAQENRAVAGLDYTRRRLAALEELAAGKRHYAGRIRPAKIGAAPGRGRSATRQSAASHRRRPQSARPRPAVQSAQAAVELAELNLQYTQVTAPVDGRISRELVTIGNLVQAGQNGGGTLLTTIVSVDPMYAYFDIDEGTDLEIRRLIREGKAQSARDVELPVLLGLANEEGLSAPRHDQFCRQPDQSQDGHSSACAACSKTKTSSFRRGISSAFDCRSASRIKLCSLTKGRSIRTRDKESSMSSMKKMKLFRAMLRLGHGTTGCE